MKVSIGPEEDPREKYSAGRKVNKVTYVLITSRYILTA